MAISNYTATTTSGIAVASKQNRQQLVISNTGVNNAFLNIGEASQADKGIFLVSNGGTWIMESDTYSRESITAITSTGTTNLSIYEV